MPDDDDNDELVLDDDDRPPLPPVPRTAGTNDEGAAAVGVIPEDDRDLPPVAETIITDEYGTVTDLIEEGIVAPFVYVEAAVNLPGWDLWQFDTPPHRPCQRCSKRVDPNVDDCPNCGASVAAVPVVPARHKTGWIPNNEEGVEAVRRGFAKVVDVPEGVEMPTPEGLTL